MTSSSPRSAPSSPRLLIPLVLDPLALTEAQAAAWQKLAEDAVDPNPFFGPAFVHAYVANMGLQGTRLLVAADDEGRWHMAVPAQRRRLGLALPAFTALAGDYGPCGTPLTTQEAGPEAAATLLKAARQIARPALMIFPYLATQSKAYALLDTVQVWSLEEGPHEQRAAHSGGSTGKAQFDEAFKGKRKKELSRLLRRLKEKGDVAFESYAGTDLSDRLEAFLQLEAKGWKGEHGSALTSHPATSRFAREMIQARAAQRGVRIDSLTVNGEPIAMLLLLIEGNTAFSWKIAYDESFSRFSPGAQLTLYSMKTNLADPVVNYGDSLAIPGHSMIGALWRGRLTYTQLLATGSAGARIYASALRRDMALTARIKAKAKQLLRKDR